MSEKPKKETFGESLVRRAEKKSLSQGGPLGRGLEKTVYIHPDDPKKVVAVLHAAGVEGPGFADYENVEFIPHPKMDQGERNRFKRQFYLFKILHILFPKNIPDMHMVGTEPRLFSIDRIYAAGPVPPWKNLEKHADLIGNLDKPTRRPIVAALESLGLDVDDQNYNFILTPDGQYMFSDTFLTNVGRYFNVYASSEDEWRDQDVRVPLKEESATAQKLEVAISERLSGEDQQKARTYLMRYTQLLQPTSK